MLKKIYLRSEESNLLLGLEKLEGGDMHDRTTKRQK